MSKRNQIILCACLWAVIVGLAIGISVKDHEPTADEIAAAETTRALKEQAAAPVQTAAEEPTTTEEVTTFEPVDSGPDDRGSIDGDRREPEAPEAEPTEEATEAEVHPAETDAEGYRFTDDEVWEMTRIVYLENGITYPECTYTTVYLTACVILNRLYDWDECADIYGVIFQKGQYSTAYRYEDYNGAELGTSNPDGWAISEMAVYEAISSTDRAPHFQSTAIQGEVYYIDPTTGEVFCY